MLEGKISSTKLYQYLRNNS